MGTSKETLFGTSLEESHVCESYYSDEVKVYYKNIVYLDRIGMDDFKECRKTDESDAFRLLAENTIEGLQWFSLSFDLNESDGEELMATFMYLAPKSSFRKML